MPRYDIPIVNVVGTAQYSGAGTNYIVEANNGALYLVYSNTANDLCFVKSTNGGIDWSAPTVIFTGTLTALSVWYDRWSNISGDYISIAYIESDTDDVLFRTINTGSSDALSTQTVIVALTSTATGGHLSITRSVGGNVYVKAVIDAGAEGGFYRLPVANFPNGAWDAARTIDEALATTDQIYLVPNLTAADNQDIMAIFWDASADEISRKLYDDSANTWSETSIATSMVDAVATGQFAHFNVAVDLTNNQILLAAWSAIDTLNADLRFWTITDSAITEKTNVVQNSTDDQGLCAVQIDTTTQDWIVYYVGKSDGSETFATGVNIYCKRSTDDGTTWGSETLLTNYTNYYRHLITIPRATAKNVMKVAGLEFNKSIFILTQDIRFSKANYVLGI